MASLAPLISRLNSLAAAHRQTLTQIQHLQQLSNPTSEEQYDTDVRVEVSSDIQQSLKDQEDDLELLRLDVEDLFPSAPNGAMAPGTRWVGGGSAVKQSRNSEKDNERDRIAAQITKLSEDLKSARRSFRRAQLSAKRYADEQKVREREEMFAPPPQVVNSTDDSIASLERPSSRQTTRTHQSDRKHLTQEDMTLAASSDVTNALRRTHTLLKSSVEQSQFAAETLASSSSALASLSESYSSLDSMLASSRSLVGSLIKSNKSDTWYLTTAFYMCATTLAWLIFRRWLYGPLWWLLWLPLKWAWWGVAGVVGAATSKSSDPSGILAKPSKVLPTPEATVSTSRTGVPSNDPSAGGWMHVPLAAKGAGWGRPAMPPSAESSRSSTTSMIDKIGKMAEEIGEQMGDQPFQEESQEEGNQETNVDDISEEERARQEAIPRNPKKRMWEEDIRQRDEL